MAMTVFRIYDPVRNTFEHVYKGFWVSEKSASIAVGLLSPGLRDRVEIREYRLVPVDPEGCPNCGRSSLWEGIIRPDGIVCPCSEE